MLYKNKGIVMFGYRFIISQDDKQLSCYIASDLYMGDMKKLSFEKVINPYAKLLEYCKLVDKDIMVNSNTLIPININKNNIVDIALFTYYMLVDNNLDCKKLNSVKREWQVKNILSNI